MEHSSCCSSSTTTWRRQIRKVDASAFAFFTFRGARCQIDTVRPSKLGGSFGCDLESHTRLRQCFQNEMVGNKTRSWKFPHRLASRSGALAGLIVNSASGRQGFVSNISSLPTRNREPHACAVFVRNLAKIQIIFLLPVFLLLAYSLALILGNCQTPVAKKATHQQKHLQFVQIALRGRAAQELLPYVFLVS